VIKEALGCHPELVSGSLGTKYQTNHVGTMDNPPLRLLLGQDAYNNAIKKTELLKSDFERMKEVTLSTGF